MKAPWGMRSSKQEVNTAMIAGTLGLRRDIGELSMEIHSMKYTGRVVTLVTTVINENGFDVIARDVEAFQRIATIDPLGEFSPQLLDFNYVKVDSKRWAEFKTLQENVMSKEVRKINPLHKRLDHDCLLVFTYQQYAGEMLDGFMTQSQHTDPMIMDTDAIICTRKLVTDYQKIANLYDGSYNISHSTTAYRFDGKKMYLIMTLFIQNCLAEHTL